MSDRACVAGASFASEAASTQTIVLTNSGNSSVTFNASATPSGLFGGWITMAPTTGTLPSISQLLFSPFHRHHFSHSLRAFLSILGAFPEHSYWSQLFKNSVVSWSHLERFPPGVLSQLSAPLCISMWVCLVSLHIGIGKLYQPSALHA